MEILNTCYDTFKATYYLLLSNIYYNWIFLLAYFELNNKDIKEDNGIHMLRVWIINYIYLYLYS